MSTYLVFSHLRWDFVFQRPQHLLSRIARSSPVLFVEEPVPTQAAPWLEMRDVAPGVTVIRPHTNSDAPGFHDDQLPALRSLLAPVFSPLTDPVVWFYTPMALPLLADLHPGAIVYDCMDELSAFDHAPRQLRQREHALLQKADIVFTGGRSLFEVKRALHPAVYCFPSSVDVDHFRQARNASTLASSTMEREGKTPRLGFVGVIDERFDPSIIAALADAQPQWSLDVVGPVVKIDTVSLPQRSNIHYLGMKPYGELPSLIASWDVCLMPFALNDATRFISPTKVLEYMAAEKPIVSTRIRDVADAYADVVEIADSPAAFVDACRRVLTASPADVDARRNAMRAIVAKTSWADTAVRMLNLIEALPPHRDEGNVAMGDVDVAVDGVARIAPARSAVTRIGTAIIGAGPTGLSASYHLPEDSVLFERGPGVGGWCRSIVDKGFTFDYAGHIMFSKDPVVHDLYKTLLGDNVHWQDREAWIHSHDVYTRYPFQGALYGLPPDVLTECLVGAIEARFGPIDGAAAAPLHSLPPANDASVEQPDPKDSIESATPLCAVTAPADDCCGDGEHVRPDTSSAKSSTSNIVPMATTPRNFEEFIHKTWGAGVAKHFGIPYNRKLWAVPLSEMETSWLGGRVPLPDLAEMIEGAVKPSKKPVGPNARFGYPLRGGFQALMEGFLPHIADRLECNADIQHVDLDRHELRVADGRTYGYKTLISTMPLPRLIEMIGDAAPAAIRRAASALRHVSVRCVNLGIGRANLTEKHWIYYPGPTVFHRVFVQGNASPHCNPEGGFGLTCEITHGPSKPLPCDGEALIQRCIADCISVGLFNADDPVIVANQADMEFAYVVYDHARAANVALIREWLAQHDVLLAGRYSEWEYYNSDHAFLAGRRVAMEVREMSAKEANTA